MLFLACLNTVCWEGISSVYLRLICNGTRHHDLQESVLLVTHLKIEYFAKNEQIKIRKLANNQGTIVL